MRVRVLGIDPGTACGWAVLDSGVRVVGGTWDLSVRRGESEGIRFLRLETQMLEVLRTGVALVAYEDVRRHLGTYAAHVYGGIVAIIKTTCERQSVPYCGILVQDAKKRATGKGNANKAAMVEAAGRQWPRPEPYSEDEADALWIALCASEGAA